MDTDTDTPVEFTAQDRQRLIDLVDNRDVYTSGKTGNDTLISLDDQRQAVGYNSTIAPFTDEQADICRRLASALRPSTFDTVYKVTNITDDTFDVYCTTNAIRRSDGSRLLENGLSILSVMNPGGETKYTIGITDETVDFDDRPEVRKRCAEIGLLDSETVYPAELVAERIENADDDNLSVPPHSRHVIVIEYDGLIEHDSFIFDDYIPDSVDVLGWKPTGNGRVKLKLDET